MVQRLSVSLPIPGISLDLELVMGLAHLEDVPPVLDFHTSTRCKVDGG